ncbi:MAG: CAP domain-containing protein [Sphingopyxis sp.]|nr:CAP domain-containing protein [Sphingopyxis sp.]
MRVQLGLKAVVGSLKFLTSGVAAVLILALVQPASARTDSFEVAVLAEINLLRSDPAAYAHVLREYRTRIRGKVVFDAEDNLVEISNEGVRAVDEAIAALESANPVGRLNAGDVLAIAAADHASDQAESGEIGHQSRGRGPGERVMARGGGRFVSEVISYGQRTPRDVVRQLIVDDGVPSRGHRHLLLTNHYRFAGVGCDSHARWKAMCVVKLADQPDGAPPPPPVRLAQATR